MNSIIGFSLTGLFAYLAYDASKLVVPWRDIPFSVIAKGIGQDVSHLSLSEQNKLKATREYGFGDLSGAVWFWAILSLCSFAAAVYALF